MEKKGTKIAYFIALAIVVIALVIAKVTNDGSGFVATGWALFPPIVAIALALISKEVYSSLFLGCLAGALLLANFEPWQMVVNFVGAGEGVGMINAIDISILIFLVMLGIMVDLMNKAGGSAAFGRWASQNIKTKVGASLATFLLGILIFIFPPLYGEGYEGFMSLMHGRAQELFDNSLFYRFREIDWVVILFVIATMFFKVIAMASTNAAGGVGGTFAPSLFVGAFTGASIALLCNAFFDWDVSVVSFTLVGMAGVMSGVMKAPLTSIFLIAELSNGYGLFIPLMITACISFAVDYYLDPDSIYTKQLRQRGELLTHDKDQSVFVFLKLDDLMETDFLRIKENFTLGDIVHIISTARRNIFPVIDNFGHLLGIVQLDDLREDMFKHEKYGQPISDYMIQPPDKILEHELIQGVMEKFEDKHTWMLPVVDKQNRYLGFISKSRILNAYREQLVKIQQ